MFKDYFKSAFRNLVKSKFYSLINIIGLLPDLQPAYQIAIRP